MLGRLDQHGGYFGERGVTTDFADGRHGTDADLVSLGRYATQSIDAANVQQFRRVLPRAGFGLRCEIRTAA